MLYATRSVVDLYIDGSRKLRYLPLGQSDTSKNRTLNIVYNKYHIKAMIPYLKNP